MGEGIISLSREGYDKLRDKLNYLKGKKRMEIAGDLDRARSLGDLSENAEYDAAKEAQAHNEKQISDLEDTISRARILDDSKMSKDEALIGATVKVKDIKSGDEYDYMLVSEEESDFDLDRISVTSPVGKALLGHKVGDRIEIKVPAGSLVYQIVNISR
ncbi:MAG: transcription elongation factor GreA [Candidatus Omnitrophica bacterium]|nr:transcription elongation factor GreA [Candidatus Omnitrophota bacterium]